MSQIRELTVERRFRPVVSDDTDAWMQGSYGYSPNTAALDAAAARVAKAGRLVDGLVEAGAPAAGAVAKGLRMQGRWRFHLIPYGRLYSGLPELRRALVLVAGRDRDPLRHEARSILDDSGGRS